MGGPGQTEGVLAPNRGLVGGWGCEGEGHFCNDIVVGCHNAQCLPVQSEGLLASFSQASQSDVSIVYLK